MSIYDGKIEPLPTQKNTLTEQWRKGKLPLGKYYIKTKYWGCDGKWHYEKEEDIDYLDGDWRFYQDDAVAEVLAPVPSYDEYKRLQEQIKDYEKALNRYAKYRSEAKKVLEKWGVK